MKEVWKSIDGFEGYYEISNKGRVKKLERIVYNGIGYYKQPEIILKKQEHNRGYLFVTLNVRGKIKQEYIHRLVAKHFIDTKLEKETVNHKDGNKKNNKIDNLEWMTYKENTNHGIKTGLLPNLKKKNKINYNEKMLDDYKSGMSAKSISIKYKTGYKSTINFIKENGIFRNASERAEIRSKKRDRNKNGTYK